MQNITNPLADLHIHSLNSTDGYNSVDELVQAAILKSLSVVAITDHCECHAYLETNAPTLMKKSFEDALAAKEKYSEQILVTTGIELGQPNQDKAAAKTALSAHNYDFVLASLHNSSNAYDYYYFDYQNPKICLNSLLDQYFTELLEIAQNADYDSLAHLTYPVRYMGKKLEEIDFAQHVKLIDEILSTLVKRKKSLEINLSTIRKGHGWPSPHFELIKRFYDLDGKYITLGSDAHRADEVGTHLTDGIDILKKIGFSGVTYYLSRKPHLINF